MWLWFFIGAGVALYSIARTHRSNSVRAQLRQEILDATTDALGGEPSRFVFRARFGGLGGALWPARRFAVVTVFAVRDDPQSVARAFCDVPAAWAATYNNGELEIGLEINNDKG